MLSQLTSRLKGRKAEELPQVLAAAAAEAVAEVLPVIEETTILRTIGWLTAGWARWRWVCLWGAS